MPIRALRMMLYPGQAEEYCRRHDALWPELSEALVKAGIEDYRIFLDPQSHHLFAIMTMRDGHGVDQLSELPVMQRWWAYMADIMDTEDNNSPVSVPLDEVFTFLPEGSSCK